MRSSRDAAPAVDEADVPEALRAFARDAHRFVGSYNATLKKLPSAAALLDTTGAERAARAVDAVRLARRCQRLRGHSYTNAYGVLWSVACELAKALFRSRIDLDEPALLEMLAAIAGHQYGGMSDVPAAGILASAERHVAAHGLSDAVRAALDRVRVRVRAQDGAAERKFRDRLDVLLRGAEGAAADETLPTLSFDPWVERLTADHRTMPADARQRWAALLRHAKLAGSAPTQKWLKAARPMIAAIGGDFDSCWHRWGEAAHKGRVGVVPYAGTDPIEQALDAVDADVLRGLVFCAVALDDDRYAPALADLAEASFKKLAWFGPRSAKVGNACVVALSLLSEGRGLGQLVRAGARVKQPSGRKLIARTLARVATGMGLTADELQERSIPTFGLVDGRLERAVGDCVWRFDANTGEATWTGPDGKPRKAVPAAAKRDHAAELKEIKATAAEIAKLLSAERTRFERLFLRPRPVPVDPWLRYYHDHPLAGLTARRLIWQWTDGDAARAVAWDGARFVDAADAPVEPTPATTVRLWHPAGAAAAEEVAAWRRWLERHNRTQPFKQAHREVYLLTDAERATGTYSNRFAGHIVRQPQVRALASQRGWQIGYLGGWDNSGASVPTLDLPDHGLRVEWYVDAADAGEAPLPGGGVPYLATDQVAFFPRTADDARRLGAAETTDRVRLDRVPPLLFSEVLRDVDLFVGVASVGNDPTWQDGGSDGRYATYWQHYSFGDLTESAKTRRDVLATLLPRLTKLRDRWTLGDRFLTVRGSRRTYKIHLGSGNILMDPNDQYLCIVPDRSAAKTDGVFLPFEGDAMLSVILSKAFLLADDVTISDPTILSQIGRATH